MDLWRYLLGIVLTVICVGPLIVGAHLSRVRLLPGWVGGAAAVAEAIAFGGLAVCALELAGVLSLFDIPGILVACVVIGGAAAAGATRIGGGASLAQPARPGPARAGLTVAIVALAALAAAWAARVVFAYGYGMETIDTLWYHLPWAARWVQTASILHLHYVDNDAITVFYPANAELFHALGLVLFHSDLISPLLNLAWAALALAAGWAIGRPYGRSWHCLIAVALVLAVPAQVDTQPGGAYNDVVCIALLLAPVAILANGGLALAPSAFAAVAAGLGLGTKFTMVIPAVALGIGVVAISPPGRRLRQTGIWAAGLGIFGGYWYLRNLVAVGNPVPTVSLHLGPLSLPAPHVSTPLATVAHSLTDSHAWSTYFLPGLQESFGPAAWAMIALAAGGSLLALLAGRDRLQRLFGAVAILSTIGFLLTPQPDGLFIFAANVGRLAAPPLALGLVLLPIQPAQRAPRAATAWLVGAVAILVATEINPSIWPTGLSLTRYDQPIRGSAAIAGAAIGVGILALGLGSPVAKRWWIDSRSSGRLLRGPLAAVAAAAIAIGGWFVGDYYTKHRYSATSPLPSIFHWAQGVHNARIGIVGNVLQYPLYGAAATNYVQYIGAHGPHGAFGPITTCAAWRRAVNAGHYGWLVLTPISFPLNPVTKVAPEAAWTRSSPAATLVAREQAKVGVPGETAELFRVTGSLDPAGCHLA